MSKFTNLLRKSSSINLNSSSDGNNNNNASSSGNLANMSVSQTSNGASTPQISTPYGFVINEKVVEPDEIKTYEKNLNDIKSLLNDIIKAAKTFHEKGESFSKNQVLWAQSFSKDHEKSVLTTSSQQQNHQQTQTQLQQEGSQASDNNQGFVKALEQFTSSITKTAGFELDFSHSILESFIKPIQTIIQFIEEKKVYRKKFDKAFSEYDNIISKIKNQQNQKKIDVLKLYGYEKDKSKLKQTYENVKLEYINYLIDTQNRMHTDFIDILVGHFESFSSSNGNSYTEYAGIKTYIDQLRTWCLSEQEFFQKESTEKEQKRSIELLREEDQKYQSLIDLLVTPPFTLWKLMSDIRKNELFPPPLPPGVSVNNQTPPPPPINFIPALTRIFESRGQLSDLFIEMLTHDLPNISTIGTTLSSDVISCEFIEETATLIAVPYLKYLFDQSITNIIGYPDTYKPTTQSGIDNLIAEFRYIMGIFKDSVQYLPPPFKKASIEIKNGLQKLSPSSEFPPIGSFLLARVFAPALKMPQTHGLFMVIPSDQALEVLSFFSTMFVNLGTNQTYISSQFGSSHLNDVLAEMKTTVKDFFNQVTKSDLSEWDSAVILSETYQTDIPVIQQFLKQHYISLSQSYLAKDRESLMNFTLALGQLEADDPLSLTLNAGSGSSLSMSEPVDEVQNQQQGTSPITSDNE
ncbi:RasGTPase-activating protein [Tieghemostelium lacteum]|uniref:RasGTPase-activating protein n=1 Tax=Tieghemostelium lacteum TaxID=361077 RepID=A0A151ZA30_TIELA|nr:RasGTPase-activating protein [Tieghemostelium lacteum]|eukprot:KYQ90795.1 RasGTPase-activating protein [Tieghemostelium lacteum]